MFRVLIAAIMVYCIFGGIDDLVAPVLLGIRPGSILLGYILTGWINGR